MRIYYQTGSDNKKIDLDKPPYWMQTGDFLDYSWEYTLSGNRISKLEKKVQEKEFTITVFGKTQAEYEKNIDTLYENFEKDIIKNTPGKLYFGEYYLPCYVFASKKEEWENGSYSMDNTLSLIEYYPHWNREIKYQFLPQTSIPEGPGINDPDISGGETEGQVVENGAIFRDFPFDFLKPSNLKVTYPLFDLPFDFVGTYGRRTINNDSFMDCDFIMTIWGFVDNPSILIGGHPYTVYTTVYEGERLVIDSAAGTIIKIGRLGEETNLYNSREKLYSVFQKIPPGVQTVSWPGTYGLDILIKDERSEPRWSL